VVTSIDLCTVKTLHENKSTYIICMCIVCPPSLRQYFNSTKWKFGTMLFNIMLKCKTVIINIKYGSVLVLHILFGQNSIWANSNLYDPNTMYIFFYRVLNCLWSLFLEKCNIWWIVTGTIPGWSSSNISKMVMFTWILVISSRSHGSATRCSLIISSKNWGTFTLVREAFLQRLTASQVTGSQECTL